MNRPSSQRGSAIIMLFVAIALFGAIAYAFMQGTRGGTSMITSEQAKIYAGQIIAFGDDVKMATKRIVLRGTPITQLAFATDIYRLRNNSVVTPLSFNPTCTTESCQVFSSAGGGLAPFIIPTSATYVDSAMTSLTLIQPGHWRPYYLNMNGVGTNTAEIIYVAGFISQPVCIAINNQLGVNNPSGLPPAFATAANADVNGQSPPTGSPVFGNLPFLNGKRSYCYTLTGGNAHKFYNYVTTLIEN